MSDGGRYGIDAPYIPRGCDMRWFTNDEICEILSRFSLIYLVGDSLMRSAALAMHILLRRDMVRGQTTNWVPDPEGADCSCQHAFEGSKCGWHGVFLTSYVIDNDPTSLYCPINGTAPVQMHPALKYPIGDVREGLALSLPTQRPEKPIAFVYGHGGWNSFNETATKLWMEEVEDRILEVSPWLAAEKADGGSPKFWPRLFMTPTAAGPNKPEAYALSQGNAKIMAFEHEIGRWIREDVQGGMEHLGLYNMSVQNTSPVSITSRND